MSQFPVRSDAKAIWEADRACWDQLYMTISSNSTNTGNRAFCPQVPFLFPTTKLRVPSTGVSSLDRLMIVFLLVLVVADAVHSRRGRQLSHRCEATPARPPFSRDYEAHTPSSGTLLLARQHPMSGHIPVHIEPRALTSIRQWSS